MFAPDDDDFVTSSAALQSRMARSGSAASLGLGTPAAAHAQALALAARSTASARGNERYADDEDTMDAYGRLQDKVCDA